MPDSSNNFNIKIINFDNIKDFNFKLSNFNTYKKAFKDYTALNFLIKILKLLPFIISIIDIINNHNFDQMLFNFNFFNFNNKILKKKKIIKW